MAAIMTFGGFLQGLDYAQAVQPTAALVVQRVPRLRVGPMPTELEIAFALLMRLYAFWLSLAVVSLRQQSSKSVSM